MKLVLAMASILVRAAAAALDRARSVVVALRESGWRSSDLDELAASLAVE